jgi:hypothetical protein
MVEETKKQLSVAVSEAAVAREQREEAGRELEREKCDRLKAQQQVQMRDLQLIELQEEVERERREKVNSECNLEQVCIWSLAI